MPLFRRKKMLVQPGEKFNPRKHIDRRKENWAWNVPPSGTSKEPTFVVGKVDYPKMAEPKSTVVRGGAFTVELLERRGQAVKKPRFSQRITMFFSRRFWKK